MQKKTKNMKRLTKKEEVIMEMFWEKGPMYVKEVQELFPEPRPHINTVSTQVRTLQANGYLSHVANGNSFQYYPTISKEEHLNTNIINIVEKGLGSSFITLVSTFVKREKLSVEELKELVRQIENKE